MQTMAVAWNGTTLNDKVKLLSVTELGISYSETTIDGTEYPRYCKVYQQHSWWLRSSYLPNLNSHSYGIYGPGQSYHPTGGCSTITDYIKNADLICTIRLG